MSASTPIGHHWAWCLALGRFSLLFVELYQSEINDVEKFCESPWEKLFIIIIIIIIISSGKSLLDEI